MDDEEFWRQFEIAELKKQESFRTFILEQGRPDILDEYDARMKKIHNGTDRAESLWHSISEAQRRTLKLLGEPQAKLYQYPTNEKQFCLRLKTGLVCKVRRSTVRSLADRELLDWEGGAFTPEAKATLSERGRFILKYGPVGVEHIGKAG